MFDTRAIRAQADEEDLCASDQPSLEWLISPIPRETFFRDYWEKKSLFIKRNQPSYFGSLLSLDEIDRVLTTFDRRYPDIVLKNANGTVSAGDYTLRDGYLDVAKVYQLFGEGATITLAFLDTVIPALTHFCRKIESQFSCPFQTNVYLTPAHAQGARPHYDTHDVFVMQVVGSKQWKIYGTPVELPFPGQEFDASVHPLGELTLEFELKAGDAAYIPRGVVHEARSGADLSLHITAGALRYSWTDLLLELAAEVSLNDPAFRKALPPGFAEPTFDRTQARETLQSLLQRLSAKADLDPILDRFIGQFVCSCPPILRGQMDQIANCDRLTVDSMVGARMGVISYVQADGDLISVNCYGRKITFPRHAADAVRFALTNSRFVIHELPGDLDGASKVVLVRRLIREGLVADFTS